MTLSQIWAIVAWIAAAIVLLANAAERIVATVKAAKAPNEKLGGRVGDLEKWRREVDERLLRGNTHFDTIDEGNRVTQRALLALLGHGIDGNNTEQMKQAKEALETHLINR